jgi:hypothetical protein
MNDDFNRQARQEYKQAGLENLCAPTCAEIPQACPSAAYREKVLQNPGCPCHNWFTTRPPLKVRVRSQF